MGKKRYIIPNVHIPKMGYTKDGRSAEELLAQAGDVMNPNKIPNYSNLEQRYDITAIDNNFIKTAGDLYRNNNSNSYPGHLPLRKAMYSPPTTTYGSTSNITMTPPQFYSPIHTARNWQIPTKRREVYLWLLSPAESILYEDLTFKEIGKIEFESSEITQDIKTEGIVYENIKCKEIYGGLGELRKPVHLFERPCENKRFIKIRTNGYYQELRASEEHCVYVINGKELRNKTKIHEDSLYRKGIKSPYSKKDFIETENWDINRIESQDIVLGDFLLTPIPKNSIKNINEDPLFFWALGLLVSNGELTSKNIFGYLKFNCPTKDVSTIKNIESFLSRYSEFENIENTNSSKSRKIYTSDKKSFDNFSSFVTGKLKTKKFTKEIRTLSKEQMLHVLGGYFDGDGSFTSQNKLVANNISKDMVDQLYFMLLMCGINVSVARYKSCEQHESFGKDFTDEYYKLFIPSSDVHKLRPYMKSGKIPDDFEYEGRDHVLSFFTKDENGVKYYARSVQSIEEFEYTGIGYDIQIDPERSYVASGFKVSNCRFFANNNATINAALRFYSEFPFSDYENVMTNTVRKEHFDKLKDRLKINQIIPQIAWEYFTMGDAFPMVNISCPHCGGWGKKKDGTACEHKDGTISFISILNPDMIDVKTSPINPNIKLISMVPDETLIAIVNSKQPKEIYDMIPDQLKQQIISKQPITLNSNSVMHMKHRDVPYITYGMSLLMPLFPILAYLDRLREAQWVVAERHILPIKICKVGNDQRPAGPQDISDVRNQLTATANDPNLTLVVHHAFQLEWVGAAGKILQLTKEYDMVDKEIIKGLGVNDALLSGEGPSYSSAAIGIEATIKRLKNVQNLFSWWITEYIYKTEARMKGFYRQTKSGEVELDVPEIRWNDLNLRDETQKQNQAVSLWEKQAISTQTLHEKLGYDYDVEVERIRMEQQYQLQMGIAPQGKKGGGLGGGFGGGGLGGGLGGNLPGGREGPGLPGDEIAPSMSGGEDAGGGPAGGGAMESNDIQLMIKNYEDAKKAKPKIHRPRKYKLKEPKPKKPKKEIIEQPELYEGRTGAINLTSLEKLLYSAIERGQNANQLPPNFLWQQQPEPVRLPRIVVDGLFPDVKLIVQADGEQWHSSPKDIEKDREIDSRLARCGWTVLRFTEEELETTLDAVLSKIIQTYKELKEPKKAYTFDEVKKIASNNYVNNDIGKLMLSSNNDNEALNGNIVYILAKSVYDNNSKLIKSASGKNILFSDISDEARNKYEELSILCLDEICYGLEQGQEINEQFIDKVASYLFETKNEDEDWKEVDEITRNKYKSFPKIAMKLINGENNEQRI